MCRYWSVNGYYEYILLCFGFWVCEKFVCHACERWLQMAWRRCSTFVCGLYTIYIEYYNRICAHRKATVIYELEAQNNRQQQASKTHWHSVHEGNNDNNMIWIKCCVCGIYDVCKQGVYVNIFCELTKNTDSICIIWVRKRKKRMEINAMPQRTTTI